MGTFVESLKRLYEDEKSSITQTHIMGLYERGKLTQEEAEYILGTPLTNEYKTAYEILSGKSEVE